MHPDGTTLSRFVPTPKTKTCSGCHKRKLLSEYYQAPENSDGLFHRCKACCGVSCLHLGSWDQSPIAWTNAKSHPMSLRHLSKRECKLIQESETRTRTRKWNRSFVYTSARPGYWANHAGNFAPTLVAARTDHLQKENSLMLGREILPRVRTVSGICAADLCSR